MKEFIFNEPAQKVLPATEEWDTAIWIGEAKAGYVRWASDRGFRAILIISNRGKEDPKHLWLTQTEEDVIFERADLDTYDNDNSARSWKSFIGKLPRMLKFIDKAMEEKRELLIVDKTGISVCFALAIVHVMVKRRVRLQPAIDHMIAIRRQVRCRSSVHFAPCVP